MKISDLDSILKAKLSRRSALRGLGALGVSPLVLHAGKGGATDGPARDAFPGASRCLPAGDP